MYIQRHATSAERCIAFFFDHFIYTLICGIIMYFAADNEEMMNLFWFIPVLYLFKDSIGSKSPGKRMLHLEVRSVGYLEGETPTFKLILRNLTLVLLPIEFFVLLSSKTNQRLGDRMCGTTVVKTCAEHPNSTITYEGTTVETAEEKTFPTSVPTVRKNTSASALLIIGLIVAVFLGVMLLISTLFKNSDAYIASIAEIETSEMIEAEIGTITSYGIMPIGSIKFSNGIGHATLTITVKGTEGKVRVLCLSSKPSGGEWAVRSMQLLDD